jgi:hypothetical protein
VPVQRDVAGLELPRGHLLLLLLCLLV